MKMLWTPDYAIDSNGLPDILNRRQRESHTGSHYSKHKSNHHRQNQATQYQHLINTNKLLSKRGTIWSESHHPITATTTTTTANMRFNYSSVPTRLMDNDRRTLSGPSTGDIGVNQSQFRPTSQCEVRNVEQPEQRRCILSKSDKDRFNERLKNLANVTS